MSVENPPLTDKQRAAVLLQLGIIIRELAENYELGLNVQFEIIRYLFPDSPDYQTAKARLDEQFGALDRIYGMIFEKDTVTQQWQLGITWDKDTPP